MGEERVVIGREQQCSLQCVLKSYFPSLTVAQPVPVEAGVAVVVVVEHVRALGEEDADLVGGVVGVVEAVLVGLAVLEALGGVVHDALAQGAAALALAGGEAGKVCVKGVAYAVQCHCPQVSTVERSTWAVLGSRVAVGAVLPVVEAVGPVEAPPGAALGHVDGEELAEVGALAHVQALVDVVALEVVQVERLQALAAGEAVELLAGGQRYAKDNNRLTNFERN